jgi:proline iminopeptidase
VKKMQEMEQIGYVDLPDAKLWTAKQGTGPALVMCHGGPGLWDYLQPVAAMLDQQATVYRFDQRACGRSTGTPPFDLAKALAELEAIRTHFNIESWILLGHSWGATLALAYGLAYRERTRALIYLAGTGLGLDWKPEYKQNKAARLSPQQQDELARLKEMLPKLEGAEWASANRAYCELAWSTDFARREGAIELARELFIEPFHPNYEVNEQLNKAGGDFVNDPLLPARLKELKIPTLVVHGDGDPRPAWSARKIAESLPNARFELLTGVGHLPWLENPEQLQAVLLDFLEPLVAENAY